MRCPACNKPQNKVINSRGRDNYSMVMRLRECLKCGSRWTTLEMNQVDLDKLKGQDIMKTLGSLSDKNLLKSINVVLEERVRSWDD